MKVKINTHGNPLPESHGGWGDLYTAEDMPDIDYLLISHDHWDHLDYATATALRSKVGQVVCPLGVGAHFEAWGYGKETVFEGDWYSVLEGKDGFAIHILPISRAAH